MSDIEGVIKQRLAAAELEASQLGERLKSVQWRIAEYRDLLGERNGPVRQELAEPNSQIAVGSYGGTSALAVIADILTTKGKAQKLSDLAKIAIRGGYGGENADIRKVMPNFSSALSRDIKTPESRFYKVSRGLFDLKNHQAQ